nr:polysaccharide deacetylase family protein [Paenibacillus senegalensis]
MHLSRLLSACAIGAALIVPWNDSPSSAARTGTMKQPVSQYQESKDRSYYEARGEIIWEVPTEQKVIALTFDDGPNPQTTGEILDLLNQYGAKATFFVVGYRAEMYPEIILREAKEGHELANHTYSHPYFKKTTPPSVIEAEIKRTDEILRKITGDRPALFRPPGGFYNESLVSESKKSGYLTVLWSWHQDTNDWKSPGVKRIVNKVVNNAQNGDIVLFHDHVNGSRQTVEALKEILPILHERGFRFVTVSELLTFQHSRSVHNE